MSTDKSTISINYSDEKLRILVEEYITQQRNHFTLQCACSYVLYWAMEDGRTNSNSLFESGQMNSVDCKRIMEMLEKIALEGPIATTSSGYEKLFN